MQMLMQIIFELLEFYLLIPDLPDEQKKMEKLIKIPPKVYLVLFLFFRHNDKYVYFFEFRYFLTAVPCKIVSTPKIGIRNGANTNLHMNSAKSRLQKQSRKGMLICIF